MGNFVVHFTENPMPEKNEQVSARCHRVGQLNTGVFAFDFYTHHWSEMACYEKALMRNALRDPKWLKMTEDDRAERKAAKEAKREGVKRATDLVEIIDSDDDVV